MVDAKEVKNAKDGVDAMERDAKDHDTKYAKEAKDVDAKDVNAKDLDWLFNIKFLIWDSIHYSDPIVVHVTTIVLYACCVL